MPDLEMIMTLMTTLTPSTNSTLTDSFIVYFIIFDNRIVYGEKQDQGILTANVEALIQTETGTFIGEVTTVKNSH